MGDLNKKNINYGALSRFYLDLKSHDLSDLNDKIDNIDLSGVYNLIYTLHPNEDYLNFSANLPNTKVRLVLFSRYAAEPSTPIDIYYSFDKKNWTHYTVGNDITIPTDGKVYLRGNNDYFGVYDYDNYDDILYYHHFVFENVSQNTLNVEAHGNINSLLSKTNWNEITALPEYCYYQMFNGCTSLITTPALPATTLADSCYRNIFRGCMSLTTAPALPATKLADYCYANMFQDCTSLTTAPELPITTLANNCYTQMFQGCTSLTTAPELPATTLANGCYNSMFYGCTSLTTAPELPATRLANSCYRNMFKGCTSLTTAPALPATTLAMGCYWGMFYDCSSLTTAPALPATTLATGCYVSMFYDCSSLTTAPALPATTLAKTCYQLMFYGCTSLNYIKCLATNISANNCTANWVGSVASTGTFVKDANMTGWTTGINGIPSGWTVEDYTEPVVKPDTLTAGQNIDITDNTISAKGYLYDETKGSFATKFLKDEYDGGGIGTNTASGNYGSFAEGYNNTASGEYGSHAEGFLNTASGDSAHVEGQENTATHSAAHAEGRKTNATNNGAHSEGTYSDASGLASHAEGYGSKNYHNMASGDGSHAEGVCTKSQNKGEHAEGCSNVSHKASDTYGDAGNTQHSIGIGTHYNSTKNAFEVMQNGDMYILGVGGYQGTDTKVQNASIKTLQEYIASLEARIAALEGNTAVK